MRVCVFSFGNDEHGRDGALLIYLLLLGVFAAVAVREASRPVKTSPRLLWGAAILLVILIGLRNEVGGDWWNYLYIYENINRVGFLRALQWAEPGYAFLNWLGARIGWGIWFPNLICAIFFVWGLVVFCRSQPLPALALAVAVPYFVIGVGMGYTRQSAAVGFILLAIDQYNKAAMFRMVFCLALAVLFHASAIIIAPLLGLAAVRRGFVSVLMIAFLAGFLAYQFFGSILTLVTRFSETTHTAGGAVPRLLMNLLPALAYLSFRERFGRKPAEMRLWTIFSFMVLLSVGLLFFVRSTTVVDRLGVYLIPLQIYVLSRLPFVFGEQIATPRGIATRPSMAIIGMLLAYSLTVQLVWLNLGAWSRAWLPYKNYLWDSGTGKIPPRWYRDSN